MYNYKNIINKKFHSDISLKRTMNKKSENYSNSFRASR